MFDIINYIMLRLAMAETNTLLAELFNGASFDIQSCAHICMDVQELFCQSEEIQRIAKHIAKDIVPAFNKLSIPTYYVWFDHPGLVDSQPRFYEVNPQPHEIIRKTIGDAFQSGNINQILKDNGVKNIILTGFNYDACVLLTALGARAENYGVAILENATNYRTDGYQDVLRLFCTIDGLEKYEVHKAKVGHTSSEELFPLLTKAI